MKFPKTGTKEAWNRKDKENRDWVFDIETNGLLPVGDKVWVIVVLDPNNLETWAFSDHDDDLPPLSEGLWLLWNARKLIGHHILGFDLVFLARVVGEWPRKPVFRDTLVMSKTLDYHRFGNGFKHSLKDWGEHLGFSKQEHEDWSRYSPEMLERCLTDTQINYLVYEELSGEVNGTPPERRGRVKQGLEAEHGIAEFTGRSYVNGWYINKALMRKTEKQLRERMDQIRKEVEPNLKPVVKLLDDGPKEAKFIKSGDYHSHTARWFGLDPAAAKEPRRPVQGRFTRVEVKNAEIGNPESVKKFLTEKGWEPDEWNWKKVDGRLVKMSSKMTTNSMEKVDYWGPIIDEYYTLRARYGILRGWLEILGDSDRLVGDMFTIGTPTGRATHSIIANIPSVPDFGEWLEKQPEADRKEYGDDTTNPFSLPEAKLTKFQKEMKERYNRDSAYGPVFRSFFTVPAGWAIVGADSSGCQVRALCHYLKNDKYTETVVSGDVHQLHTDIAKKVSDEVTRSKMKRVFFAMIFGAGVMKLGNYITGSNDAKIGAAVKDALINRIGGFKDLLNKIERIFDKNRKKKSNFSWLPGIDFRKIYIDSPHKGLNYLVQSCEAVTCKQAATDAMRELDREIGPDNWFPLVFMHDEIQIQVKEEYAEKAREISEKAFTTGPAKFGVKIMAGEAKIGKTWMDSH